MRVAGLAPLELPGIENFDVTQLVPGHMAYRTQMPRLLREVGWLVDSDEFTEIEDPDPENHEKRQRELINEIEGARKELQDKEEGKKKGKFGFGSLWGPKRKAAEKKDWEMYDERMKSAPDGDVDSVMAAEGANAPGVKDERVLFDVDAIRREAAELATQGIEIKQLESTLPPMKLDVVSPTSTSAHSTTSSNATQNLSNVHPPPLRQTQSYDAVNVPYRPRPSTESNGSNSLHPLSKARTTTDGTDDGHASDHSPRYSGEERISMTFESPSLRGHSPSPVRSTGLNSPAVEQRPSWESTSAMAGGSKLAAEIQKPEEKKGTSTTAAGTSLGADPLHNAWAEEETEYKGGGGMEMTFE